MKDYIGFMQQNTGLVGQKGGVTRARTDKIHMALLGTGAFKLRKQFMQNPLCARNTFSAIGGGAFGKIKATPKIAADTAKGQRLCQ